MKRRVLYSEANYPAIVRNKGYFVDKTHYVELLETVANPVFLRPRRSCPQGRSDLEFVGKYNEIYADMRWVIEFKYFSNSELRKFKTDIADFQLRPQDTEQIAGYAAGLREEYPEARISLFVIYCFGNQGFRVFEAG